MNIILVSEKLPKARTITLGWPHLIASGMAMFGLVILLAGALNYGILRFAAEPDMDTSYAAWRLKTPVPYSIKAVTRVLAARISMPLWVDFLERHPDVKQRFEYEVMRLMSEVMAHTITLHLLDAPGRLLRFMRKHPDLLDRIPKKELATYLNLAPETLSRLKQRVASSLE